MNNQKRKLRFTFIILIIIQLNIISCESDVNGNKNQKIKNKLDLFLQNKLENNKGIGLVASVIFSDGFKWDHAVGYSDRIKNIPLSSDMQFGIASITKVFVASQILLMVNEGSIKLDDQVSIYIDPIKNIPSEVTIRSLLNHTSGIYNYVNHSNIFSDIINEPSSNLTLIGIINNYVREPEFPIGTRWGYSNTNYIVLAIIIEKITGKDLGQLIKENFLTPHNLDLIQSPSYESLNGDIAIPWFDINGDGVLNNGKVLSLSPAMTSLRKAAGGMYSTSSQLATWGKLLYEGEILPKEALNKMLTFYSVPNTGGWVGYGLGTQKFIYEGYKVMYGHNGLVAGYSSSLRYSETDNISVVVISNDNIANTHLISQELMIEANANFNK